MVAYRWFRPALGALLAVALSSSAPGGVAAAPTRLVPRGYNVQRCGAPSGKTYLTYDDANYRHPHAVLKLARSAHDRHVGLGIFHVSSVTRRYRKTKGIDIPKRLRMMGMYVGNHTVDHPDLTTLSLARLTREIRNGVHGGYLRPPYGTYNSIVRSRAHELGYRLCTWTFDTNDWKGYSAGEVCSDVVHDAPSGAVVLMHLNHRAANPRALGCIVHGLRQRGRTICRPYTSTHPGVSTPIWLLHLPC
jgi:peptidoglycan/xylan/chitin deacetylase (PgdA/CDA1 family)